MSSKTGKLNALGDPFIALFKSIGLNQAKAAEAAKSPKAAAILRDTIQKHSLATVSLDEKQASLFAALASAISKASDVGEQETSYIVARILDGKLKSVDQVSGEPASFPQKSFVF